MSVVIGSKYEETKVMLREKIREGSISVLKTIPKKHTCYFCRKRIYGEMRVLTVQDEINGYEMVSKYYLHDDCYRDSRRYIYDEDGVISSLN